MYSLCFKLYTNYTQTLHSEHSKPYTEAFKTLHGERSQNYTRSGTQTIHFVFEHESREWNLEREWSESYVTFVTNVTNVSNVTNVKQEMVIGGDALRHSCAPFRHSFPLPQKIQQFWANFQRFDINIFNFSEHFPPPHFAYSACSFALPSPNLN